MSDDEIALPLQLEQLSRLIGQKPESLAVGNRDIHVASLKATKYLYDIALESEAQSRVQIADLLTSISPSLAPQTRSKATARNENCKDDASGPRDIPDLEPTPLTELFVEGMDEDQIWSQLELRAEKVCRVLSYALDGVMERSDSEEEGGVEDEVHERMRRIREAIMNGEDVDMDDFDGMDVDSEGDDNVEEDSELQYHSQSEDDEVEDSEEEDLGEDTVELRDSSDEEEMESEHTSGVRPAKRKAKTGSHPELDDGFFDLAAFNKETEEAEAGAVSRGRLGKGDSDDEEDAEDEVDLFAPVDDTAEVFEEDDLEGSGGDLFYKDFFDPPARVPSSGAIKSKAKDTRPTGRVRFHDQVKVKNIKARGKNLPTSSIYDDEDDEDGEYGDEEHEELGHGDEEHEELGHGEDEDGDDGSMRDGGDSDDTSDYDEGSDEDDSTAVEGLEEDGLETMEHFKDDLFADEAETQLDLSTHEKRMSSLREEIAALEADNVAKKDWTLMGEATSRSRPQNSLLEEDLEYERVMKSVPVITEETVQSLEERIKARIVDGQFDDVVRRRPVDDKPFLPSRFFELQDTKSKQSLAEIYEDEYTAARTGGVTSEDRDGKLKKEHDAIEKHWEQISGKLDALCNAHFTPKTSKASISTVSNVAAASMENALPTTMSTSSMLAPEEVFAPPSANDLQAHSELTPVQKRALRNKQKKAKKKARDALEKSVDKFAQSRRPGSVRKQKEVALKSVVKSGKGVTVVGKQVKDIQKRHRTRT